VTPNQRTRALHAVEADLIWLHSPLRPTCTNCRGERAIGEGNQRKECPTCDGIGTTRPTSSASPMTRARTLLLDGELQAAVIAASHPEGASDGTDGDRADPTGEAAVSDAAVELRANEIRQGWRWSLNEAHIAIRDLTIGVSGTKLTRLTVKSTLRRIRWLTEAPHHRLNDHARNLEGDDLGELDHAIGWAVGATQAVRYGPLTAAGKNIPSVESVITTARKTVEVAPPKPKQKPLEGCVSCARDARHFEPIDDRHRRRSLCRVCGDYFSGEGSWPPLGAVQYVHRTGKRLSWKVIEDAKRAERAS